MSRRPDPARIYTARREANAGRLRDTGMLPVTVAAWLAAWERIEPDRAAADYLERGLAWIEGEVAARRKPPMG